MIQFKPVTLADKDWMDECIRIENSRSCDFNFTNIYIWRDTFVHDAACVEGELVLKSSTDGKPHYSFPIGGGNFRAAVLALFSDAEERGEPFMLRGITSENAEKIDRILPCSFKFIEERNYFDYVYSAEKLASLSGKHLHAKRNFINRFEQTHSWHYEPVDGSNLQICTALSEEWAVRHAAENGIESYTEEQTALSETFRHFGTLGLEGGLLYADGAPVAFTLGERLCSDTFVVHFEKAFSDIDGAYPMINREFVRWIVSKYPDIVYINREDDMGAENLRRAKQSYYPEFMVEKYIAVPL